MPGLITRAAADLALDLSRSFMVGDRLHDLQAGLSAGTGTVLVRTGYGAAEEQTQRPILRPQAVADNLAGAAAWILQNRR
jgi:D-glycero-D-manno-heptose 1,7-bisphosphate phosphatase